MELHGLIHVVSKEMKIFIAAFVVVLSVGYASGLLFVGQTSSTSPKGIQENYLGNEEAEDATVMKFKKGEREILTIIHTHILSMSFIFAFLGLLLSMTSINKRLKFFLMIEPFVSILVTFGGIYLMWKGFFWFKYIIVVSGTLMTFCYTLSSFFVLKSLFKKSNN